MIFFYKKFGKLYANCVHFDQTPRFSKSCLVPHRLPMFLQRDDVLTLKAPNKIAADDPFNFLRLSSEENNA